MLFNHSVDIIGEHGCWAADLIFNFGIETVRNFEEAGTCALVQIGDSNACRQFRIIRMHDGHIGTGLCRQIIQVVCLHTYFT